MSEHHPQVDDDENRRRDSAISRRGTLGLLGLTGLTAMTGQASATSGASNRDDRVPWRNWDGHVDANGKDLYNLGGLAMTDSEAISDFAGDGLSIDDGVLTTAGSMVDTVDIDDYGADPTGAEPSDDALDAAIDELSDGDTLLITNGEYWFDASHEIFNDHVTVLGTGSEIRISGVTYGAYSHWLSFGDWTAVNDFSGDARIAEDVTEGQQTVEVEDASPFSVGDDVTISESKYNNEPTLSWGGTAGRGTCPTRAVIRDIDGSRLYLDRGLNYDHEAGNAAVFLLDSVVGGRFVDLHMIDGDGEEESEGFLMCAYARDCQFINCTSERYVGFAFTDIHSLRTKMIDCEAKNPILPDRASSHWEPFQFRGSTDPTVVRPSIDTCRRGIDINAGSKVVTVVDPRIRNAYLHGMCFHSNASQSVFGAYEVYGGRVEGAAEILHDKYHFGYALSTSPTQSHVKAFGTTFSGVSAAVHTPGQAKNLTLEGCTLETNARSAGNVVNGNLKNSRLENVDIVARGNNDDIALDLDGAEDVAVSGQISGSLRDNVVSVANAENVTLDIDVLDNENDDVDDVAIEDSRNVTVSGTLHGAGRSVTTSGTVSDIRIVDLDAEANSGPAIGHVGGDGPVSNVWITRCNTSGGTNVDVDFESELEGEIAGLWIQNNAVGDISFHGSGADGDKFVSGNLTVEPEESDDDEGIELDGDGTEADPYVIDNADHLQAIDQNLSAHYVLGSDVDASVTEGWNDGDGFEPLGTFTGSLDGDGHAIEGLYIDLPILSEIGMFSELGSGATIRNLALEAVDITADQYTGGLAAITRDVEITNVSLTGTVDADRHTGGLVGWHEGRIENADVDATVSSGGQSIGGVLVGNNQGGTISNSTASGSISGRSEIGGIAGWNDGGSIENCYSDASVDAAHGYGGGLSGIVIRDGTVSESSADSEVTGGRSMGGLVGRVYGGIVETSSADGTVTGEFDIGGFVGTNADEVRDCYATASATATDDDGTAGGFVGRIGDEASVSRSYAVGDVSGAEVGGLAGANGGTLVDSYWDTETTGVSDSVGSGESGGEGLTTPEMTGEDAETNMSALDFADTWTTTASYPQLAWE